MAALDRVQIKEMALISLCKHTRVLDNDCAFATINRIRNALQGCLLLLLLSLLLAS